MARIMAMLLLAVSIAGAQQQEQAPAQSNSTPTLVLASGQAVVLRLKTELSSERSKVGDIVEFEVVRPVKIGDLTVIADGAVATGKVVLVERRRRKGREGKLAIVVESVRLTTGDSAPLRGTEEHKGENKQEEVNADMGEWTVQTFGFGAPLAPLFMLRKGGSAKLEAGTKVEAKIAADITLDREKLESGQPVQRRDVGIVYLFRGSAVFGNPSCGSQALGLLAADQFQRLELPPGRYWFRGNKWYGRGWEEKIMRRPIEEFTPVDVEAGATYYLRVYLRSPQTFFKLPKDGVEVIDASEGEKLLQGEIYRFPMPFREITPEILRKLQTEPALAPKKG